MNIQYSPSQSIVARAATSFGMRHLRAVPPGQMAENSARGLLPAPGAVRMRPAGFRAASKLDELLVGIGIQKMDLAIAGLSAVWCLGAAVQRFVHL